MSTNNDKVDVPKDMSYYEAVEYLRGRGLPDNQVFRIAAKLLPEDPKIATQKPSPALQPATIEEKVDCQLYALGTIVDALDREYASLGVLVENSERKINELLGRFAQGRKRLEELRTKYNKEITANLKKD